MAFVLNFVKLVRTHWKKSIVFTGLGVYGVKYGKERYEEDLLRRQYCAEAKVYGEQISAFGAKNRKITVFLNPAACGGKAKKLFEKNAAPLLNLAGLEVNVVRTEYDGQIKEFFKYLEQKHVDGVVAAGGNGTLLETITGMMRKDDKMFRQTVPVGVIPVGDTNNFATFFYGAEKGDVRRMLDSAMAVVKGVTKKLDVLQIQGEDGKGTFALCGLETGAYRDAKVRTSKYWYFGPIKHKFTYLRSTLSNWPPCLKGNLEYIEAKETDLPKMKVKKVETTQKQSQSLLTSLLYLFVRPKSTSTTIEEEEEEDFENLETLKRDICTLEFTLSSNFDKSDKKIRGVQLELGPEDITKSDFITEGWSRIKRPVWTTGCDSSTKIMCRKVKFTPDLEEGTEQWYTIDGEQFEAMPIEVTLLRNRLKMFTCEDNLPS